ncbi:MAG: anhydro-N-acetylmuramic acid kinase [Limisphaerales bacterium]
MFVLGIMSGTSLDGADFALCRQGRGRLTLEDLWSAAFPAALRRRLLDAAGDAATVWELGRLHHDLGRFYARAALHGLHGRRVEAAGLHGQTVFHAPPPRGATLQIGSPAWLAEALRVPVVADFRGADLAAGGHAAPLASLFHLRTFARRDRLVAVQNLGGIGNVTSLDWRDRRRSAPAVLAFDTGPANLPLDLAAAHVSGGRLACDRDGRLALSGRADARLVARWLRDPFIRRPPPKSTGRERYGGPFFRRALVEAEAAGVAGPNLLATLTAYVAATVAENHRRHLPAPPGEVILCGGGAENPALVAALREAFGGASTLRRSAELGWPAQAIEPAAFALLALERLRGRPGNLPSTTGAARAVCCGAVWSPG